MITQYTYELTSKRRIFSSTYWVCIDVLPICTTHTVVKEREILSPEIFRQINSSVTYLK